MRSFQIQGYAKNRNNLRYLITNPFTEPPAFTFLKLLEKEKVLIINKNEQIDTWDNKFTFKVKKREAIIDIMVNISRDHLINITVSTKNENKSLTTRVLEEALLIVKEFIC